MWSRFIVWSNRKVVADLCTCLLGIPDHYLLSYLISYQIAQPQVRVSKLLRFVPTTWSFTNIPSYGTPSPDKLLLSERLYLSALPF